MYFIQSLVSLFSGFGADRYGKVKAETESIVRKKLHTEAELLRKQNLS